MPQPYSSHRCIRSCCRWEPCALDFGGLTIGAQILYAVVAEYAFQCSSSVAQAGAEGVGVLKLQEGVGDVFEIRAVAEPPLLGAARCAVNVNIFRLHQFEQAGFAVSASPAAEAAAAVRRFGDCVVADGVVDHHGAGPELGGD